MTNFSTCSSFTEIIFQTKVLSGLSRSLFLLSSQAASSLSACSRRKVAVGFVDLFITLCGKGGPSADSPASPLQTRERPPEDQKGLSVLSLQPRLTFPLQYLKYRETSGHSPSSTRLSTYSYSVRS